MGLIERIKSALGIGTSASSPSGPSSTSDRRTGDPADGTDPTSVSGGEADGDDAEAADVTVEHEPDAGSEEAVKGTDPEATGASADVEPAEESGDGSGGEPADGDGDGPDDEGQTTDGTADARAGVDLEEVKGIGPAYADRLREAGIEDVAALAAADAADVSDRTGLGEGRVQKWIDRAGAR